MAKKAKKAKKAAKLHTGKKLESQKALSKASVHDISFTKTLDNPSPTFFK